jgi:hypothetical protein
MPSFEEALKGERALREMEAAKAFKEAADKVFDGDTVLVQPDPNSHMEAIEDE